MNSTRKYLPIIFLLWWSCLSAQHYEIRHFNPQNGLNGIYVYASMEDAQGYKWVSTDQGLSRFDGQHFEIIERNDSSRTNFPTAMICGEKGERIFGYHNGSIKVFNGLTTRKKYVPKNGGSPIRQLSWSDSGNLWALTQNDGIIVLSGDSTKVMNPRELRDIKSNAFFQVERFVLVGSNEGVLVFRMENSELTYLGDVPEFRNISVEDIKRSKISNALWGATESGLYRMDAPKYFNQVLNVEVQQVDFLKDVSFTCLEETEDLDLWLGTKYEGVIKVNFNRDNSKPIQFSFLSNKSGFPGDQISTIHLDSDGNAWVGTIGDGLIQVAKKGLVFFNFEKFRVRSVNAITGTKNHEYYYGTDKGLIKGYFPPLSDTLAFEAVSGMDGNVTALFTNEQDQVFLGIQEKGLYRMDHAATSARRIEFDPGIKKIHIRQITQSSDGNLWVVVKNHGVFEINLAGQIVHHYSTTSGFYHNEIFHLHIDSKGNKWFAAHGAGLARMDSTGNIDYLSKEGVFPARDINDISEDEAGNIWIGTYGNGVFEYDGKKFIQFTTKDGLLSDYCNAIVSDKNNHIWLSHRIGLTRIDEFSGAISTIEEKDGLSVSEFLFNSIFQDQDHNIWIGNRNGVTFLSTPDDLFEPKLLKPIITDIKIKLQSTDLYQFASDKEIVGKIPKDLTFPYDQNKLTFEFIAINLKDPESNLYQFKLDGYEEEWSPPTSEQSITYTNLKSGDYSFMVRHSDNPNFWGDNITIVPFSVKPPWWGTWWAILLFIIALVASIYGIIQIRTNQLQDRLAERKHFADQMEGKNRRLREFSYIMSHNTRSSVGNIIGLVDLLEKDPDNHSYFDMLKVTVNKLNLTIDHVNDLLNLDRHNVNEEDVKCDVEETINRVVELNSKTIDENEIDIDIDIPPHAEVKAIPAYLESVFNNLLTNAIRYGTTNDSKKIEIYADISPFETIVSFKDYGVGFDTKKHKHKLFRLGARFHANYDEGQGIGLYMCKDQLESMGGHISIESAVDKGTTVKVELPTALKPVEA